MGIHYSEKLHDYLSCNFSDVVTRPVMEATNNMVAMIASGSHRDPSGPYDNISMG